MTGFRLPTGRRLDRAARLRFFFEGREYSGYEGDTLASALIASGVSVVGRSFKYHRPRGVLGAGLDEPNAIVEVGTGGRSTPNLKATTVELYDGLQSRPVNAWPSLKFDALAINSAAKRFLPAGFYYKTFMWPDWHLFEPFIRRAAGLGRAPDEGDPDFYDACHDFADVLVVGGGITGLLAARTAARAGARVFLIETDFRWGGGALSAHTEIEGMKWDAWVEQVVDELRSLKSVVLLDRTTAFGFYDHGLVGLHQRLTDHLPERVRTGPRERLWKVRAKTVLLATGAFERPLVFANNDRPGVMLSGAASSFADRFGAAVGQRIILTANNSQAYEAVQTLTECGVNVELVLDARADVPDTDAAIARTCGAELISSAAAINVRGQSRVSGVQVARLNGQAAMVQGAFWRECDTLLMSGGWSPAVHLQSQAGGRLRYDPAITAFLPASCQQSVRSVGAAAGDFELAAAITNTLAQTKEALSSIGLQAPPCSLSVTGGRPYTVEPLWAVNAPGLVNKGVKSWVDFQNDVTSADVTLAVQENYRSVEHVKRYTTLGMASDQGKTSNVNAIGIMEALLGKPMGDVGTTKFRPPFDPVSIGAFAGRRVGKALYPSRSLPAAATWLELGAKFEDYGSWSRPAYFGTAGQEEAEAVREEVLAVRRSVGVFDASPLGKIEVKGPDAGEFLNRIYVNNVRTLKVGKCRYGIMLNENGIVFDDGVLARFAEDYYLVGTTSGHAATVFHHLREWHQCEWPHLKLAIANVTANWAVINIAGPKARDVLQAIPSDIDWSAASFDHMACKIGQIDGLVSRVQRVSFSGELSFEISVPWKRGPQLLETILRAGKTFEIRPFGVEALMVLRIEKGFLHVGSETDGVTYPQDIGFAKIVRNKTSDFVGRRSTMRLDGQRDDRRQLVGLEVLDAKGQLSAGTHIIEHGATPPCASLGWVTSSASSPTLNRPVALAMLAAGASRTGEILTAFDLGVLRPVKVVSPEFVAAD